MSRFGLHASVFTGRYLAPFNFAGAAALGYKLSAALLFVLLLPLVVRWASRTTVWIHYTVYHWAPLKAFDTAEAAGLRTGT